MYLFLVFRFSHPENRMWNPIEQLSLPVLQGIQTTRRTLHPGPRPLRLAQALGIRAGGPPSFLVD